MSWDSYPVLRRLNTKALGRMSLVIPFMLPMFQFSGVQAETIPARPAVVRGNVWHLRETLTSGVADVVFSYGRVSDRFLMGDWDGDGIKTPGVVRGNTWYLRNSNSSGFADVTFAYGSSGDIPIAGDWDGDGTDTIGVVRPDSLPCGNIDGCSRSSWHLRNANSSGSADLAFTFSFPGVPVVGDWDGDGDDTPGVRLNGLNTWQLSNDNENSPAADVTLKYGSPGDIPVAGDWNGDESESVGVFRGGIWFLRDSNSSGQSDSSFKYGSSPDETILVWGDNSA